MNIKDIDAAKLLENTKSLKNALSASDRKKAFKEVEEKGYAITEISSLKMEDPKVGYLGEHSFLSDCNQVTVETEATAEVYILVKATVKVTLGASFSIDKDDKEFTDLQAGKLTNKGAAVVKLDQAKYAASFLKEKVDNTPEEVLKKLGKTAERVIDENKGGVICILL